MAKRAERQKSDSAPAAADLRLGSIGDAVAFHLSIANTLSLQTFLMMVGEHTRNARYIILSLIRDNPGVTQAQLSETNFRDKSSMSPLIAEFAQTGLVRREKILRNGRAAQALFLTSEGERLWEDLRPVAEAHTNRMAAILGDSGNRRLIALLRKLSDGLAEIETELRAGGKD